MKPTYKFELQTLTGDVMQWRGLTKATALAMYRATEKQMPHQVKSFGWCLET